MIDLVLYNLEKQFSIKNIQLCLNQILSTDLETGQIKTNVIVRHITKAIMLPITVATQVLFRLANRDFGISDVTQRTLVIRSKYLKNYVYNKEAYFIIDGSTYNIVEYEPLDEGYVFILRSQM